MPAAMPEPDVVSGFDEGEFTYDDYEDMLLYVRNHILSTKTSVCLLLN